MGRTKRLRSHYITRYSDCPDAASWSRIPPWSSFAHSTTAISATDVRSIDRSAIAPPDRDSERSEGSNCRRSLGLGQDVSQGRSRIRRCKEEHQGPGCRKWPIEGYRIPSCIASPEEGLAGRGFPCLGCCQKLKHAATDFDAGNPDHADAKRNACSGQKEPR